MIKPETLAKRQKIRGLQRLAIELQVEKIVAPLGLPWELVGGRKALCHQVLLEVRLDARTRLRLAIRYARSAKILAGLPALLRALLAVKGPGLWLDVEIRLPAITMPVVQAPLAKIGRAA